MIEQIDEIGLSSTKSSSTKCWKSSGNNPVDHPQIHNRRAGADKSSGRCGEVSYTLEILSRLYHRSFSNPWLLVTMKQNKHNLETHILP